MKQPYLSDILRDFKIAAYRNAVRLFRDACTLYAAHSHPTALAVGVLAYEELGKALYVQRVQEAIEDNPGSESEAWWYEVLKTTDHLRDHRGKQKQAFYETVGMSLENHPMTDKVRTGELDREKQQALYVELVDDQILTPERISQGKAYQTLRHVLEVFEHPPGHDWAFQEWDEISTPRSQWQADEQLTIVRNAFATCARPT